MAPAYFFTYIGVFFACSITFAVVIVKQFAEGFSAHGKKPYLYGLVSSSIASGIAFLSRWVTENMFLIFWLLAGIYLLFGIIHMALVHKKYFSSTKENQGRIIIGEIIFGLSIIFFTIVVFSTLQYFIQKDREYLFYPVLLSTITFFIPFLFMQAFQAAYKIPTAIFKTWQYSFFTVFFLFLPQF